ncbi:glycoside hydrolase family 127 protein [soil metagenome]
MAYQYLIYSNALQNMKTHLTILIFSLAIAVACKDGSRTRPVDSADSLRYELSAVTINDSFWSPKLKLWQTKTVNDVFDKFEGKYRPQGQTLERDFRVLGVTRNAFLNFDLVAEGKRAIGKHHGPPWYDGLIYETIRGSADLLSIYTNAELETRIDGYIDRIAKAQASEPDGYIDTYTQLMEPDHRWGFKGGMLRWQHDVYNAGMLVEAGVHYYQATGKTKLLAVAVKMANYMYQDMGPHPKKNVVPAHSGPEEALMKLYYLFRDKPELKSEIDADVNEKNYYELVKFWIEARGQHVGLPTWNAWGNEKSEKWIRDVKYDDPKFGEHRRPSWGDYAQDSIPALQQKTIVGHAVRATLLATGVATVAAENRDPRYIEAASSLWDNMVGRRMFITGGVGAIANDEKFGDDYYLPNDAYLETCAAVGAGFFSQRMNTLTGKGKYIDEFERTLYNGVLTGISLQGDNYTYQNPLISNEHHRWEWHDCPCCPPMFLKIMGAIPDFIYSVSNEGIIVHLFIGSVAEIQVDNHNVTLQQVTNYPWEGSIIINVNPEREGIFNIKVRIPGWATGDENPFGLYQSKVKEMPILKVNGSVIGKGIVDGYISINRSWKKGDKIELGLSMQPRLVFANDKVHILNNMTAVASGPLVYCFEKSMNTAFDQLEMDPNMPGDLKYQSDLLNGVNVVTTRSKSGNVFKAIPYFAVGNFHPGDPYKVWIPVRHNE